MTTTLHTLNAISLDCGRIDEVIVPGCILNGYVDRRFTLDEFQQAYIRQQHEEVSSGELILLSNLKVHFEGSTHSGSWASARIRWIEEEKVWIIASLYNSHGLYDYARAA